jgi:hypothetical protein
MECLRAPLRHGPGGAGPHQPDQTEADAPFPVQTDMGALSGARLCTRTEQTGDWVGRRRTVMEHGPGAVGGLEGLYRSESPCRSASTPILPLPPAPAPASCPCLCLLPLPPASASCLCLLPLPPASASCLCLLPLPPASANPHLSEAGLFSQQIKRTEFGVFSQGRSRSHACSASPTRPARVASSGRSGKAGRSESPVRVAGPSRRSESPVRHESPVRVAGPSRQSESPFRVADPSRRSESPVRVADPSRRSESPVRVAGLSGPHRFYRAVSGPGPSSSTGPHPLRHPSHTASASLAGAHWRSLAVDDSTGAH